MTTLISILRLAAEILPQWAVLVSQAIEAHEAQDQAALDAVHARALAASEALRPAGR
jgi:hypothetical protein